MKAKKINEYQNFEKTESGEDFKASIFNKLLPCQKNSLNAFIHFCNNYHPYFIEEIWGNNNLGKHFRSKFEGQKVYNTMLHFINEFHEQMYGAQVPPVS